MSTITERPKPPVDEIERSIDSFFARIGRAWKQILILAIIVGLIWFVVAPNISNWLQYILFGAYLVFQLLFAAFFMIFQFVALFWFLGRPRMYWILPGETGVGFKDYRGNPEVLETASRIVALLKGVKEFKAMGGQVTRGVLLVGPPGTGKSYLGHCISTEAGVPFGYLSAPSIQGMFWGMDVMRIWSLYRKARSLARKYGACILFIDEIDAIGMRRAGMAGAPLGAMGGIFGGGAGALNQLLTEMDPLPRDDSLVARLKRKLGLKTGRAEIPLVLTMGATNIVETLDPALLRPGRFDRKIFIDLPDYDGRKEIIKYYLDKVAHEDLDLDRLASETIGQSPAAIKFIINEAVINAHFNGRTKITYEDFAVALDNHEVGLRHPIRNMLMEEKRALAYHEAGHAVAMLKLYKRMRVTRVTIIRHEGGVLGFAMPKPVQETYTTDRNELLAHIQVALAARAAEELFLGTQLSGVFSDLQQATRAAAAYIGYLGMNGSLYSTAAFGEGIDPSMKREIEKLLREQFIKVKNLLNENRDLVIAVAETLLQRLELNGDDLIRIEQEVERRKRAGEELPTLPEMNAPVSVLDLLPSERDGAVAYQEPPASS
ncbi:MAG TPA: AAA family ATPase [Chloroflexota bacterium]|jgi:cell division protease FtsH|nr:AAA family ATPase [Chloroflexota bacterium]